MPFYFFPRDRQFWLYHLGASGIVMAITVLTSLLWSNQTPRDIAVSSVWIIPFTFTTLLFRKYYKARNWKILSMGKLIVLIFFVGAIAALLITIVTVAAVTPTFWQELLAKQKYGAMAPLAYFSRVILSGSLQIHITVCAWFLIYVGFSKNREIKSAEITTLQLQNTLKEAQLSSLSNQLNPHFLFNSLNNIRFMIHENSMQADSMLISLSDILRYSLESSQYEKLTLEKELDIIERYIRIVKVQHENRLQFSIDVAPELRRYLLPPMILQMLIENAIKHGIDHLRDGGKVCVEVSDTDQELKLSVKNDCAIDACSKTAGVGIGLKNIERRLQLLYGARMRFEIVRTEKEFIVLISLPKETSI